MSFSHVELLKFRLKKKGKQAKVKKAPPPNLKWQTKSGLSKSARLKGETSTNSKCLGKMAKSAGTKN